MSSVIYFLSDAHLGAGPEPDERLKRERLAELFERIKADRAGLYILGDLFDFWFEYRTVVPAGHLETISLLRGLRDSGIRGNLIARKPRLLGRAVFRRRARHPGGQAPAGAGH
jgi:UDP-2,3-diacylglucosamine pyrophosphatase LpxH